MLSAKVDGARVFVISDKAQRRRLNTDEASKIAEIKRLAAEKKRLCELVEETKNRFKAATKKENSMKAEVGKKNHEMLHLIEKFLWKHSTDKPYYHGGNIMEKP
jgi:hypothetical protein